MSDIAHRTYEVDVCTRRGLVQAFAVVAEQSALRQIVLGRMNAENMEETMRVQTTLSGGDVLSEFRPLHRLS
jgi:hypothetical protein